jgi:HNH endonuclease
MELLDRPHSGRWASKALFERRCGEEGIPSDNRLTWRSMGICMIEGCGRSWESRKMCHRHYENWRLRGSAIPAKTQRLPGQPPSTCSIGDCGRPGRSLGLCNRHYENLRLRGSAIPQRDIPVWERITAIGWQAMPNGCQEWNGTRNEDGYGLFGERRVHRLVYEHHKGQRLDPSTIVRHTCDNPPCGNPDHLLIGDHQDNMRDMVTRRRHHDHNRTHCRNGHDVRLPGATKFTTRGENLCLKCDAARKARYEARKRAQRADRRFP